MTIIVVAVFLLLLGLPLAGIIGMTAWAGLLSLEQPGDFLVQGFWSGLDNFSLTAILGFILAGNLMTASGLTDDLVDLAKQFLARFTSGLGLVTIAASLMFSALSGSGGATCAAVGSTMIPAMIKDGYPRPIAAALAATGGILGILIPPSIPMIIYAVAAKVPVNELFLAGIIPGLVLTALLAVTVIVQTGQAGLNPAPARSSNIPSSGAGFGRAVWKAKWSLALIVIIMGGIWGGFFTPSEAAIVAVLWILPAGLINRRLKFRQIHQAFDHTAVLAGAAVILLAPATALARFLALAGAPQALASWAAGFTSSPAVFLMALFGLLLLCGLITDTITMIAILTPILLPAARQVGVDPLLMGLIFIVGCEAGFLTPPFGGNLFIVTPLAKVDIGAVSKAVLPYVAVVILMGLLLIWWPSLGLWLPGLLR